MSKESELKEAGLEPCPNPWCRALLKPSVEECESGVYISCCVDGPPRMSYADAIAAWNTRAQDTVPRAVAVELLRLLKRWQNKFHDDACYAGMYRHGVPIEPRKWCELCEETNAVSVRAMEAGLE